MADISSYSGLAGNPRAAEPGTSAAERILARYTHDEQRVILHNLETLAATAQFMGQDFSMRVLLNEPGKGWHWDFQRNEVRVDPETMLRAPIDVSRAIYCHEGFHRRITPKDGVPEGEWREPGLPFLVNSIEDPRIENFGGEAYPAYRPLRDASYRHSIGEATDAAKQTLGRAPRHVQAGLEIIHQWFREVEGKPFEIPVALDPSIRAFLEKALPHAQDASFAATSGLNLRSSTRRIDGINFSMRRCGIFKAVERRVVAAAPMAPQSRRNPLRRGRFENSLRQRKRAS